MLFTDPVFLFLFLPVVAAIFYLVAPRFGTHAGFVVLVLASLVFYAPWGLRNSLLLVASFTVNFAVAYFLLLLPDARKSLRSLLHALGQLYNFGMLFWFKYSFFVTHMFSGGGNSQFSLVNIAIPIGISFYTFQQAMFLLETHERDPHVVRYMGEMTGWLGTARAYLRYVVFVVFFPHLVIGPIVYLDEFQPQVDNRQFGRFKRSNIEVGIVFLALGMFKKVVLADNLAPLVNTIFVASEQGHHISMVAAWIGAVGYYAQLYFDFSGYADMALGAARLFGVRYPMNFYSPLKSVGILEFYRRWHITLTRVIARFMFTPLSLAGTRFAARRKLGKFPARAVSLWLPFLINFEVIALWHGARWTFIVFGIIHGTWYIAETEIRRTKSFRNWTKRSSETLRAFLGRAIFFVPMVTTFALFRSDSLGGFTHLLGQMFAGNLRGPIPVSASKSALMLAASFAVIWLLPNSVEFLRRYRPAIATYENKMYVLPWLRFAWRPTWAMSAVVMALFLAALYFIGRRPPFLYMGF
jgi:alginate O-acetyltransferase complex protein AlgI